MTGSDIRELGGAAPDCPKATIGPRPDPRLVVEGWEPRFLVDSVRSDELITLYRELGFQVRAEPIPSEALDAYCVGCQAAVCRVSLMIYTRSSSVREAGGA